MTTFLIYFSGFIVALVIGACILKYSVNKEELYEDDITDWAAAIIGISLLSWVGVTIAIALIIIFILVNCLSCILYNWINNK